MKSVVKKRTPVLVSENHVAIMQMYADGVSTVEIAARLGISTRTVEGHVDKLRFKYDANSRSHLVAILLRDKTIK